MADNDVTSQPISAPELDVDLREPPRRLLAILSYLGPGLIMAASIVGSGELIATTITGAKSGIYLLWLILIGCMIKALVQIEIGRATIISGKQTLSALATVPGPAVKNRGNWIVWYWFFMWFCSISQLGGIVGGCGQALAIVAPLTNQGKISVEYNSLEIDSQLSKSIPSVSEKLTVEGDPVAPKMSPQQKANLKKPEGRPIDDILWCIPITLITCVLLIVGRYNAIQSIATTMVVIFTAVTVWNVMAIQSMPNWRVTGEQFIQGLSFGLPPATDWKAAIFFALSTIGIIGVGAAELIQYPYWCLEKGYARWTGRNDGTAQWANRAKGWLRVMKVDAMASLIIYTFATIAFFILGVAILHRSNLIPEDEKMLQTLMSMYTPVFGEYATPIFIVGGLAVLYSTFFVANASHARTFTDAMCVVNIIPDTQATRTRWIKILSGLFPILCLVIYYFVPKPGLLVQISGAAQTVMLPMLGYASLVFRFRDTPPELKPSKLWDVSLIITIFAMLIIAGWQLWMYYDKISEWFTR
jgi:Mn2+/Fe2+ NRAMP family transporter